MVNLLKSYIIYILFHSIPELRDISVDLPIIEIAEQTIKIMPSLSVGKKRKSLNAFIFL